MSIPEYEKGLLWDEHNHTIKQSWNDLKQKITKTHGGLGIVSADFDELLRYGYGWNPQGRREIFSRLVEDATTQEDIKLLASILAIILLRPWEANLQGGWFIYYLRRGEVFDAERAALVLNELFEVNDYSASVLIHTLRDFVIYDDNNYQIYIVDLLKKTNMLRRELLNLMNQAKIFISYAKEDNELVEKLYDELNERGYSVWKDNYELLPGENWEMQIKQRLSECDFIITCLSKVSVAKTGFFQDEVKSIYKLQRLRPATKVFCIPVILNEFDVTLIPPEFDGLQYINIYDNWNEALEKINKTILKHYANNHNNHDST